MLNKIIVYHLGAVLYRLGILIPKFWDLAIVVHAS
jgi:hypothetical protein